MQTNSIPKIEQLIWRLLELSNSKLNQVVGARFRSKLCDYDLIIASTYPGTLKMYLETRTKDPMLEMRINTLTQPWSMIGATVIKLPNNSINNFDDLADELKNKGFSKPDVVELEIYSFLQFISRWIMFWILKLAANKDLSPDF